MYQGQRAGTLTASCPLQKSRIPRFSLTLSRWRTDEFEASRSRMRSALLELHHKSPAAVADSARLVSLDADWSKTTE
jgi:hypothetical protein